MSKYYLIRSTEDGISVEETTGQELQRRLREGYYGEQAPKWAASIPDADPNYWRGASVIIKGEIVQPRAVEVVKEWELP